jgi:hypothetical protein
MEGLVTRLKKFIIRIAKNPRHCLYDMNNEANDVIEIREIINYLE